MSFWAYNLKNISGTGNNPEVLVEILDSSGTLIYSEVTNEIPKNNNDTDWHELAKERFAKDLSDILYKEAHAGTFERLVIVAAPQVLGVLRSDMHKEVLERVVGEIPKTLTNHTIEDIEKIVKSELDAA